VCLLGLNKLFVVKADRPNEPLAPMNRNNSGTSKALFIYQADFTSFMQNMGFFL
jgi:hypothetical protein